jgi:integrase
LGKEHPEGGYSGVRPRANSIELDFRFQGVRLRPRLRWQPTPKNLMKAEKLREQIASEIKAGTFNFLEYFPDDPLAAKFSGATHSRMTVESLMVYYLKTAKANLAKSTYISYQEVTDRFIIPKWGATGIQDIKSMDVRYWMAELLSKGHKAKYLNNVLVPMRQAFKAAYEDELIDSNPMGRVKNLPFQTPEPDPFNIEEMKLILDAFENPIERYMWQFSFWTGLRTNEVIALRWEDVNLKDGLVSVKRGFVYGETKKPKTSSGVRSIELTPPAAQALRALGEQRAGPVFVCPWTLQPWTGDQQLRVSSWTPAVKRAGVRYRCPYQTRHTFASTMLSNGAELLWVAQMMGHKDFSTLRTTYAKWLPVKGKSQMDELNKRIDYSKITGEPNAS